MKKLAFLSCAILAILSSLLYPQDQEFILPAVKAESLLVIDGIIDEKAWERAPAAGDFIQYEPEWGKPISLKTVAKVLYDADCLYFAFFCFDPEPEKIVVGTNRRDSLSQGSDVVTVTFDTFHDRRTAYWFRTNLAGVQEDGRIADNGRITDMNWDTVWKSAGSRTQDGWSAEMAIPFASIKFKPGENMTWGLQMSRYIPRNMEKSFWTGPLKEAYRKVTTYGTLTGISLQKTLHKVNLIPHVLSGFEQNKKATVNSGLDATYDFSQFFSGHLTVNPDFATVEADREQVNLTRFELNFPEKRHFFLEDNEIYQQKINMFYSRRISDIYGGVKVYGKSGGYEFSAQSAQTNEEKDPSANFSALRIKRDVMQSSALGFILANKLTAGNNQGNIGLDAFHYFTKTFNVSTQLAMSYKQKKSTDFGFFIRPSYDSATFHIHLQYSYLGDRFGDYANAVGFVPDDNRHEFDSAITKNIWLRRSGIDRIVYSSNYNIYWGIDKVLRSWDISQGLTFDLKNKMSLDLAHEQEFKLYEKEFRNHNSMVKLGYNTRQSQSVSLGLQSGKNFDSNYILVDAVIRNRITQNLTFEYNLSKLSYSPDPRNKSTWIHILVVNQYFSKDLFMKLFYQVNSNIDKQNIQIVFSYRFQPPFGLIQLAYQKGTAKPGELGNQGHSFFLKLAYML